MVFWGVITKLDYFGVKSMHYILRSFLQVSVKNGNVFGGS